MMKPTISTLLATVLLVVPASGRSLPQEPALFRETVDVRVMNLEAVVTRGRGPNRGEHVSGLDADDFVLEVDGAEIPIEYFTEVRSGVAEGRPGSAASSPPALPALPGGEPVPTRILVFVDNYCSIAARRDAVLRRLSGQLDELGPYDQLAVVAYDGTTVEIINSWSRDREEIRRALRRVSQLPAYGLQRHSDYARLQSLATYGTARAGERSATSSSLSASSFSSIGFRGARREPRFDAELGSAASGQVSRVALAAMSALRGFARPVGRKVLLLLSGGLPALGDLEVSGTGAGGWWPAGGPLGSYDIGWSTGNSEQRGGRRLLAPLVDTANRLGFTIYPVDLGASAAAELPSAADATLAESLSRRNIARDLDLFSEDALLFLARSTGGEAYLDSSRFVALRRVVSDTRSYYWIGFTPTWRQDDGLHHVELTARRPGVDVRTRDSFSDLSRSSVVSLQVESAHLFDSPLLSSIQPRSPEPSAARLRVEAGPPKRSGFGRIEVPLRLTLPLDRLTLLPTGGAWRGRAEVRIVASDDRGEGSPVPILEVELASEAQPAAGAVQVFETTLELRRRPHRLLVAVHDPLTGVLFGARLRIEP